MPFFLAPEAALATYQFAGFGYDADLSHFDNTPWTWATDYGLALVMACLIFSFPKTCYTTTTATTTTIAHVHVRRSQGMLACYMISVFAGGLAHQFYTTLESRGYLSFRILWIICVGTVTAAPAFMGSIATELNHLDREITQQAATTKETSSSSSTIITMIPAIPAWIWSAYAVCSTLIVAWGGMSYQRPACDIFMAGVTQTPSTFYVMLVLGYGLQQHYHFGRSISKWTRLIGAVGFILNAPLLPMYPMLVQYTDWSLGSVNALLHAWLCVAWSTQGLCLRKVAMALDEYDNYHQHEENQQQQVKVEEDRKTK